MITNIFIIVMIVVMASDSVALLILLARQEMNPLEPGPMAVTVVVNFCLILWAFYILTKS